MHIRPFSSLVLTAFIFARAAQADLIYSIQELGHFAPVGINNHGEVVGNDLTSFSGSYWSEETGLVPLPNGDLPTSINNHGVVAGSRLFPGTAFRWTLSGGSTPLTLPFGLTGTSSANGINDQGQVVGDAWLSAGQLQRGILWNEDGSVQFLTDDAYFQGWNINNSSTIVGTIVTATTEQAAVWTAGTGMSPLTEATPRSAFPSLPNNYAYFVSAAGLVGGVTDDLPFFWTEEGGLVFPDVPAGMIVGGFNGLGQIVGQVESSAYLWSEEHGAINLNDALDISGEGWELTTALRTNDVGQIVGIGRNPLGESRAFLLTPVAVPEASSFLLGGLGLAIAAAFCRKRR